MAAPDVVERRRFDAQVAAGMAGARATAAAPRGLPLLGVGLGQLMVLNPLGSCCRVALRVRLAGGGDTGVLRTGVVGLHHESSVDMTWAAVLLAAAMLIGRRPTRDGRLPSRSPGQRVVGAPNT